MEYRIEFTAKATAELVRLQTEDSKAFHKALKLIDELKTNPRVGTGHPEPLKGKPEGRWSRRITKKHRMVYRIFEEEIVVLVLTSFGHYDDK